MTKLATSKNLIGVLCALTGGILWGFSGSCAQFVFSNYELDSSWMVSVRIIVAGAIMMLLALGTRGKRVIEPVRSRRNIARIILFAVFGLSFTQFSYLTAISYSNAGTATVLEYIGPVLVVVVVCVRDRRAPQLREIIAMICVVVGTFVLATHGDPTQLVLSPPALVWGLLSAVSVVFYSMLPEPLLTRYDNVSVLAWAMIIAAVCMAAVRQPWTTPVNLDLAGWLALIGGLTVVGTVVTFLLYFKAIELIGSPRTSMIASSEVVSATLISVCVLGTPFELADFIGLVIIMATVFLLAKSD